MPEDIRDVPADQYWQHFETVWTGLLSYRYLGRRHGGIDRWDGRQTMGLRHDMRNRAGGIMAAPLCIASPESGGMADDLYVPNPVIASMQVVDDARDVREIEMRSETVHLGRQMGFSRTVIVAEHPGHAIALSEGMGVSLGSTPEGFEPVDNPPIDVVDSPDLPPLHAVFGCWRRDDGSWQLGELSGDLASPDAALHLGPIHVLLEAAATDLAAEAAGTDLLQVEDWHVQFVARGKVGPFRTAGRAVVGNLGRVGVQLTLHDEGNGDRVITTGSASFRPVG